MLQFNIQFNIGRVKYVINHHDGVSTHKDGSKFFSISTFSNKVKFNRELKRLKVLGYIEK